MQCGTVNADTAGLVSVLHHEDFMGGPCNFPVTPMSGESPMRWRGMGWRISLLNVADFGWHHEIKSALKHTSCAIHNCTAFGMRFVLQHSPTGP